MVTCIKCLPQAYLFFHCIYSFSLLFLLMLLYFLHLQNSLLQLLLHLLRLLQPDLQRGARLKKGGGLHV